MVKVLYILRKRSDLDHEAFRAHWKDRHAPIALRLPGLRRYVQSHPYPDPHGDPLPADGVDELQFDSIEAMQEALATPQGQAMLASLRGFLDTERSGPIVIEEEYQAL